METVIGIATQIELSTNDIDNISKSTVNHIHQQNLLNNKTNINATDKIVATLGGVDKILTDYLSSENNLQLAQNQLIQINHIISSATTSENTPAIDTLQQINETSNNNPTTLRHTDYILSKTDTYLHIIFGIENGTKVINFLFGKPFTTLIGLLFLTFVIWWIFFEHSAYFYIYEIIIALIGTLNGICVVMSLNKTLFEASMKTFSFWFKTIVAIQISVSDIILVYVQNYYGDNYENYYLKVFGDVFEHSVVLILVILMSSIDGFQAPRQQKIGTNVVLSIGVTIYALITSLKAKQDDVSLIYFTDTLKFSVYSAFSGGLRVLSIFLWQQTILSIIYKGDKCVNITTSAKMKWVDEIDDIEQIDDNQTDFQKLESKSVINRNEVLKQINNDTEIVFDNNDENQTKTDE
eukprot:52686_1